MLSSANLPYSDFEYIIKLFTYWNWIEIASVPFEIIVTTKTSKDT